MLTDFNIKNFEQDGMIYIGCLIFLSQQKLWWVDSFRNISHDMYVKMEQCQPL